ncbi:MAG: creatininase family protein [Planctomycetales bacterium]|nr:creatininase family protein [Planctomycetales bacterium]
MKVQQLTPLAGYLPRQINQGAWVGAYTLPKLKAIAAAEASRASAWPRWTLPICSLGTPYEQLEQLGPGLLPPLYHEALTDALKAQLVARIQTCFPVYRDDKAATNAATNADIRIVELPSATLPAIEPPAIAAFSVDTTVEEHGPHLPLATDTIQSYDALERLQRVESAVELVRPVDYGQLAWGLPFGMSVDITADLLAEYVQRFATAIQRWLKPGAIYVVDVHGSITHREAIVAGLRRSEAQRWKFRWLHEPLAEFASERGDQHAGGVETRLVEQAAPTLLDREWWPDRLEEIARGQMDFATAVELTPDLAAFQRHVEQRELNGIIGDILNYQALDTAELVGRIDALTLADARELLSDQPLEQHAGQQLW